MTDPYKYFMIEVAELLDNLNRDILEFEKRPDDEELLKRLFRYAHTLKGASHVVGLLHISKLAHSIEDLFGRARDHNIRLVAEDISLILDTLDLIGVIVKRVKENKSDIPGDTLGILERFKSREKASGHPPDTGPEAPPATPAKEVLQPIPSQPLTGNQSGPDTTIAPAGIDLQSADHSDVIRVPLSDIDYLMDQASELITCTIRIDQLHKYFKDVTSLCGRMLGDYRKMKAFFKQISEFGPSNGNQSYEFGRLAGGIDVEALHSRLLECTAGLDASLEELREISESEYQVIHKVRSIRVSDMSHYFNGAVRDLSVKLNKKLTLVITGDDIELDRNLLEELKEPVNHILRNAAVHGIEDEAERLNKGKDREGIIRLDFEKTGDFVHIVCQDDGRGINTEKIKKIALKTGLIDEKRAEEIGREDSLYLVFAPGVSSGEIITEFAGRGVGLDIVKDKVESLRGTVTIETEEDKFTRLSIKLPLSLNMIDAFLVEASGQEFLIPLNMVMETGYISPDEIEHVAGKNVIKLNELPVSLMWLSDILQLDRKHNGLGHIPFVYLKSGHETATFAVDRMLGIHKILLKGLGEDLRDIDHILGGAILSDGRPVLVLNVAEFFETSATIVGELGTECASQETLSPSSPDILLVDDSLTTRVLISGVLESQGYGVTLATSGEEALNIIEGNRYDLFIIDVEMPGINGFELTVKVKEDPDHKDTPVVILSSLSKDEHKRKGIEVGAQAYIVKGMFDQEAFLDTVRRLV